jgi:hypothetical protein
VATYDEPVSSTTTLDSGRGFAACNSRIDKGCEPRWNVKPQFEAF